MEEEEEDGNERMFRRQTAGIPKEHYRAYIKAAVRKLRDLEDDSSTFYRLVPAEGDNPFGGTMSTLIYDEGKAIARLPRRTGTRDARRLQHTIIDSRESDIIAELERAEAGEGKLACISLQMLKGGDTTWSDAGDICYVMERKDREDAANNKHRMEQQIVSLLQLKVCKHRICFLLEGRNNNNYTKELGYYQAMGANAIFRDGFTFRNSEHYLDSLCIILANTISLAVYGDAFAKSGLTDAPIASVKGGPGDGVVPHSLTAKSAVRPFNALQHFLATLPLITMDRAFRVLEKYKYMPELIDAFRALPLEQRPFLLADLPFSSSQRFGPTCSETIYCHLFPEEAVAVLERRQKREEDKQVAKKKRAERAANKKAAT